MIATIFTGIFINIEKEELCVFAKVNEKQDILFMQMGDVNTRNTSSVVDSV